ncbi:hypothetical protein AVEN_253622-1 [Araneus ventricosus]|uniref:Uncharacterized protein n=1 Tax=Araneus ventricosus TaxID=182803 RepID=A0A4Y2CBI2_ARAVE|nr:hypothetical protein AVEN_253622-1 [Araneus ventricosus]
MVRKRGRNPFFPYYHTTPEEGWQGRHQSRCAPCPSTRWILGGVGCGTSNLPALKLKFCYQNILTLHKPKVKSLKFKQLRSHIWQVYTREKKLYLESS